MSRRAILKGCPSYINKLNKVQILHLIREEGTSTRAQISRLTGLSAPSVTRIVDDLIKDYRLVKEAGRGDSSGGRRPNLICLDASNNYLVGLQLGEHKISAVLANLHGEIYNERSVDLIITGGLQKVMQDVADLVSALISDTSISKTKVICMGVTLGGVYNENTHILEQSSSLPFENVDLSWEINKATGLNTVCSNYANCMAIGENWFGEGQKYESLACLNVGYNTIGAGIIVHDQLFSSTNGRNLQFGHIPMKENSSIQCGCGCYGCLQSLASGQAIIYELINKILSGEQSVLKDMCGGDLSMIDFDMIIKAMRAGDALANDVFKIAAATIGNGVVTLIHLFHPQAIFIGGEVARAGDELLECVWNTIQEKALSGFARDLAILPATFGDKGFLVGAVALALKSILNLEFEQEMQKRSDSSIEQYAS